MTAQRNLASIAPQSFSPEETIGEFTAKFIEGTQGRPPELVAMAVWRLCNRAYLDGLSEPFGRRNTGQGFGR